MQVSSPSEIRKKHKTKLHQLPSGLVVEICKIDSIKLLKAAEVVPADFNFPKPEDLQRLSEEERNIIIAGFEKVLNEGLVKLQQSQETQLKATEFFIVNGVNNPKVLSGSLDEVGENEVHISDFDEDLDNLVEAIVEFSGLNEVSVLNIN